MPKRTRLHHDALLEHLQDPRAAAHYLNAALEDSDAMLLVALRNVAEASKMSKVAEKAGISRESIYRMLSESGNPTYDSFTAILRALGLRIAVEADIAGAGHKPQPKPS
jgi:probable addiction module antidote protein